MSEAAAFGARAVLAGLTGFQRRTVDHVMRRFHHDQPRSRRFLVADETGLGKSIVARGVIAETIAHLEDDPSVERIDIVYVCSNTDLAKQNLARLNVTGERKSAFSSRLTLLAKHSHALSGRDMPRTTRKPVNLVSFTPGTSFDHGHRRGKAEERAMVALMLRDVLAARDGEMTRARLSALYLMFQGGVTSRRRFVDAHVEPLASELGEAGPDPRIFKEFRSTVRRRPEAGGVSLLTRVRRLLDQLEGRRKLPDELWESVATLTSELRATLARCAVVTLEPDLIILDEFQRFRDLLDPGTSQGELAHHLFDYPDARVLLLSATPYKPFTYGEESEDHARDFYDLLGFLSRSEEPVIDVAEVRRAFATYRDALWAGGEGGDQVRETLSASLRRVMSRWDRPLVSADAGTRERTRVAENVTPSDLVGYVALERMAQLVGHDRDQGMVTPEYWKSAPYFASFCQGYRLATRLQEQGAAAAAPLRETLRAVQSVDPEQVRRFDQMDLGGARMRALVADTLDQGWWRFLWMPPSLPYLVPGGVYASGTARSMTKRLLFSSWTATPSAVAAVLSYEAERRIAEGTSYRENTPEARRRIPAGLAFSMRAGRPGSMSSLMLMWPHARLSQLADPRALTRANGGSALSQADAVAMVREQLRGRYVPGGLLADEVADEGAMPPTVWRTAFADHENWPDEPFDQEYEGKWLSSGVDAVLAALQVSSGGDQDAEAADDQDALEADADSYQSGLERHIRLAATVHGAHAVPSDDDLEVLARIALFGPGCISLRVVRRLVAASGGEASESAVHVAAAHLATGLRSLFNRPDVTKLVDPHGGSQPYWSHVLGYIADGNLEAVLDEWVFHVWSDGGSRPLDDESVGELFARIQAHVSLRSVPYQALDLENLQQPILMNVAFALRYGARQATAEGDARQPEVRAAFNSPFWPFVLASTSVGQEGIDFHWWCHAVFHWNTPANPVDFEQREGRVDRFRGHAVRKNIASRHGRAVLLSEAQNPWAQAYAAATDLRDEYGDFTPDWVYPGPSRVERHVAPLAFSTDGKRYDRVKRDVALYRLAFGQPRQEDLVNALRERDLNEGELTSLRIDLTPPEEGRSGV